MMNNLNRHDHDDQPQRGEIILPRPLGRGNKRK